MAQSRTSTNHAVGSSPAFTGAPGTLDGWWITPGGQHIRFISLGNSTDSTNVFELTTDITAGATNEMAAYTENTSSNQNHAPTDTAFPLSSWGYAAAVFSSASVNSAYSTGANKGTHTTTAVPSGVNRTAIPGRVTDFTSGARSFAHVCAWPRALSDLEIDYRKKGGNPRWLNYTRYWKFAVISGTPESPIVDQAAHENLTVTGLTASVDGDPVLATYWTAAAFGNQSHTQGSAISAVDLTTKFDQMAATVDYTCSLRQLSVPGSPTIATAAATIASNLITVNSVTGFAANSWASVTNSTTPVLILDISGNTLLLGAFLTWGAGDSVYPIGSTALTLTGPAISANSYGGTPAGGDVGTYTNCYIQAANNTTGTLIGVSPLFNITVASSGAAPSFSSGPTLTSANTDGYSFSATSTQTATWYLVAAKRGSTAPTGAQVKSGSFTGSAGQWTAALTAATPGTLSATGLTLPVYDLYSVVDNGSGTSAVSAFVNKLKSPGSTQQYVVAAVRSITAITKATNAKVTVTAHGFSTGYWVEHYGAGGMTQMNGVFDQITVVDANNYTLNNTDSTGFTTYTSGGSASWGQSIDAGASTAVATGDVRALDLVTTPDGLPITCQPDGAISILAGSVTARQNFGANNYSVSAGALIGLTQEYFQDSPPTIPGASASLPAIFLAANQTIAAVNVANFATDPQGDTPLTVTSGSLPNGLTLSAGSLSGTSPGNSIVPVTFTWANNSLESVSATYNLVIGQVTPPDLTGSSQGDIVGLLAGLYLNVTFGSQDDAFASGPRPQGTAIAQNPPPNIPVNPNSTINVTLSTGNAPPVTPPPPPPVTVVKSPQIVFEESVGTVNNYRTDEAFGSVVMGPGDSAGQVYRVCRIPVAARPTRLEVWHEANPSGSLYAIGVCKPNGGGVVLPGSDRILVQSLSMDSARSSWTDVFSPAVVGGVSSLANAGKRLWELLGLSQDPSPLTSDSYYDVTLTAISPGSQGGTINVRLSGRLITSLRVP